jgi:hypothetical protein
MKPDGLNLSGYLSTLIHFSAKVRDLKKEKHLSKSTFKEVIMKFRTLMPTFLMVGAISTLFLIHPFYVYSADSSAEPAPVASGVYEGEVIEVEEHTLVIKQADGDIVRVRMPGKSGEKSSNFQVGDKLDVVVSPEGITTSVKHRLGH